MSNNIPHETINEIITDIYMNGLKLSYSKYQDNQLLTGYYLNSKYRDNMPHEKITQLPQLERIFINVKSKAKKVYGPTNLSDFENQWSEALTYLYEAFYSVFSGSAKVEEALTVSSTDDIYRIINDEKLAAKLCRYSITYVDMKFKTYLKRKSNPDYKYNSNDTYTAINYLYLDSDNDNGLNHYEELEKLETISPDTGDLTQYIMDNYFGALTSKQQLFLQCYLWFGQTPQGHIVDDNNNMLYMKQEYQNYKNAIAKALLRLMREANDTIIYANNHNRFDLNWKGAN